MNHELVLKLKNAGFPFGFCPNIDNPEHDKLGCELQSPTLSELIAACGDEFVGVRNFRRELLRLYGKQQGGGFVDEMYDGLPNGDWMADSTRAWTANEGTSGWISEAGKTPIEAVANLWLSLNSKT